MAIFSLKEKVSDSDEIPESIYGSVVRSLYADSLTMIVGILSVVSATLVVYWKVGDPLQILFAGLFTLFGISRILLTRAFESSIDENITRDDYELWNFRYFIAGTTYYGLLGAWFMFIMIRIDDAFAQLISLAICMSMMIGTVGRNFASERLVSSQVIACCICITTGLSFHGELYHVILAIFIIPFFVAIRSMSKRLRLMLFNSVEVAEENKAIAEHFNIALANVRHGIAMLDNDGKTLVINDRFEHLARIGEWDVADTKEDLFQATERPETVHNRLRKKILDCWASNSSSRFNISNEDGQSLEVDYNSIHSGGVVVLADISERVRAENSIRKLADFDSLTNLPNRRFFVEEVERLLDQSGQLQTCSMFFIDLDKFKEINDTLGHRTGDALLKVVAGRLSMLLDNAGMICRFGGDEFVIVIPGMNDPVHCSMFARSLIRETQEPILIDRHTLQIGASIGIAIAPYHGKTADDLLQSTDSALYQAKANGRQTYAFYTDELGESLKYRRKLEVDLGKAIDAETIEVYYQPLVNLKTGRINTCEALLRWDHPEYGRISPEVYVKIAEEVGSINQLGEYVMRKAMTAASQWPDHVRVAVNVSSVQFRRGDVAKAIDLLLAETGLSADRFEVEVTESVMLEDMANARVALQRISDLGVRLSLDDFGTGFSNLSYLHTLPFDKVKIDRSFIEDGLGNSRSLTLLQGVVELIKRLNLSVVLEGIENDDQMEILSRDVKVDEVQGFFFSKPLSASKINSLLNFGHVSLKSEAKGPVSEPQLEDLKFVGL